MRRAILTTALGLAMLAPAAAQAATVTASAGGVTATLSYPLQILQFESARFVDVTTVRTVLQSQTDDGHLTSSFVAQPESFLANRRET
ncbi:MAG TPA: hypothetical protein VHV75_16930 [Solirubrobacteraceae bacterium]|nr:hypothetical protein [Solirubrobacteraceae bacterium]